MTTFDRSRQSLALRGSFDGDHGPITGTTKNAGTPSNTPVRRRVRLHDQATGLPVRDVWSDATTGAYVFDRLAQGIYETRAYDHTGLYNGEGVTDIVVPAP